MAAAPHLVQALEQARDLAAEREDQATFKAVRTQAQRVLERLDEEDLTDPAYTDDVESEGPVGDLDPDAVDLAVASLTALTEQPTEEQAEIALTALTDLEDVLPDAPGPGAHPGA